jgi:hypothetical protein
MEYLSTEIKSAREAMTTIASGCHTLTTLFTLEVIQRLQANKESQLELKEKLTKFYNKDENK